MDAETPEHVFKMVGRFLQVNSFPAGHHNIEMGIDKLLVLAGNDFLHLFDIFNRNQIARIGYGGNRQRGVVDLNLCKRTDLRREVDAVNIYKRVNLAVPVAHADAFLVSPECAEGYAFVGEVHSEKAVNDIGSLCLIEELRLYAGIAQLVGNLADFHKEVAPLLAVVAKQAALLALLRDCQVSKGIEVGA